MLEVEGDTTLGPGQPGVERCEETVVTDPRHRQTVHRHTVEVLASGGIVVGPVEVVHGARREDIDPMAASRQARGELAAMELGTTGHLAAIALDDEQEAFQPGPPPTTAGSRAAQAVSMSSSQAKCSWTSVSTSV